MKITEIETYKYWASWCNWLFVKVSTDEGLYGWGEGSLHGSVQAVETAIHELKEAIIGQDPSRIEYLWHAMYGAWRWRGGPILSTAIGAIDIALWDIEGKRLGVPVYRLLGGPFKNRLRVYASHWLRDSGTTPSSPEEAYEGAKKAIEGGFSGFKWNPFDGELLRENEYKAIKHAEACMAAAREGAGPEADIFIECSEQLSPRTAISAINVLAPYRPGWIEEPIPFENASAMCNLQREISVPIACGERLLSRWQFQDVIVKGACKVIQPDVMHAGGITEVRKICSLADTNYISVAPHNPGGPICNLASMHLAASISNFYVFEQMEAERSLRDRISTNPVKLVDGFFDLPDTPGLGTDLVLDQLDDHQFRPQPAKPCYGSIYC